MLWRISEFDLEPLAETPAVFLFVVNRADAYCPDHEISR